jgi:8-oxo-dGTP diphosphatase
MTTATGKKFTADTVLFSDLSGRREVLLVTRKYAPFKGKLAFPGGGLEEGENPICGARRELFEETHIAEPGALTWLGIYAEPGRDPRGDVVTHVVWAVVPGRPDPIADDDAAEAGWYPLDEILATPERLAFDHHKILTDAAAAARSV